MATSGVAGTDTERRPISRAVALNKARDTLSKYGLDALIATSHASTFYLAGVNFVSQRALQNRLAIVVVHGAGEPVFIVENMEAVEARASSWLTDVRTYS